MSVVSTGVAVWVPQETRAVSIDGHITTTVTIGLLREGLGGQKGIVKGFLKVRHIAWQVPTESSSCFPYHCTEWRILHRSCATKYDPSWPAYAACARPWLAKKAGMTLLQMPCLYSTVPFLLLRIFPLTPCAQELSNHAVLPFPRPLHDIAILRTRARIFRRFLAFSHFTHTGCLLNLQLVLCLAFGHEAIIVFERACCSRAI